MTFLPGNLYHSGFIVADLDEVVASLQEAGVRRWTAPKQLRGVTARLGEREVDARFRYSYSCDGPHHLELIEPEDDALFTAGPTMTFHHFGFWSQDLERDVQAAAAAGMPMEVEFIEDATGRRKVTYHRNEAGLMVELVPESSRPTWEERWASVE